jgi:hypothetical protein
MADENINYYQNLAKILKDNLEKDGGEVWNVIIGTEFGAYVAFEKSFLLYFRMNELYFLVYRLGYL